MSRPPVSTAPISIKTAIRVADFDASRSFYADLLGLAVIEEWDEEGDRGCVLALCGEHGGGLIELAATSQDPAMRGSHSQRAGDKLELQIETRDLAAWAARLRTAGLAPEGPVDRPWGNRYLWVRDPDGVRVALFERLERGR